MAATPPAAAPATGSAHGDPVAAGRPRRRHAGAVRCRQPPRPRPPRRPCDTRRFDPQLDPVGPAPRGRRHPGGPAVHPGPARRSGGPTFAAPRPPGPHRRRRPAGGAPAPAPATGARPAPSGPAPARPAAAAAQSHRQRGPGRRLGVRVRHARYPARVGGPSGGSRGRAAPALRPLDPWAPGVPRPGPPGPAAAPGGPARARMAATRAVPSAAGRRVPVAAAAPGRPPPRRVGPVALRGAPGARAGTRA